MNWVVPTFNGELRTDKPPLHYFLMILAYKVFGMNEFAARFFSAFFGACTVVITYLFARSYLGQAVARWTVAVLLSSLHFTLQFHLAVPDPYLIFFITAAAMFFYLFHDQCKRAWLFLFYLFLGLGTLAKGPVAILLPGLGLIFFLIGTRGLRWSFIAAMQPLTGAIIVAITVLPWYLLVHHQTGGAWTEGFFLRHNVGRFTDTMEGTWWHFSAHAPVCHYRLAAFLGFHFSGNQSRLARSSKPRSAILSGHCNSCSAVFLYFKHQTAQLCRALLPFPGHFAGILPP